MTILRKTLSDSLARSILLDPVDFKLVLAKYYLSRISDLVPLNYNWEHFVLESNCESFLFYSNLAIEVLTREIRDKYNLPVSDDRLTIYRIKDQLDTTNQDQKTVYGFIDKYFQTPRLGNNAWDTSNTSLWQLRELRNHIAHSRIINRQINVNVPVVTKTQFLFYFTVKKANHKKGTSPMQMITTEDNPHLYFSHLFDDLLLFRDEIRKFIPNPYDSLQHRNQLDFEL